ncbi:hypothetical protein [Paraburkholderia diazotrophica]|uniref:Uncharacterized protein n=1 Tax=Paraburkholderia diazotrophica TaxID=667676 RepID=A0A1H7A9X8_9BURK|nr:hypothetical protein [Paraburkholderia diazotrophica]SEJ58882.1 hypothetical protein SAMN05192539_1013162 [Paraburkholderia diazotrophica]
MKATVVVKDLSPSTTLDRKETALTPDKMKSIVGGRSVAVTVDGTHNGTVDDWAIDTAIFEGRIKGPMI